MGVEEIIERIALALRVQNDINYGCMTEIDSIKARLCKLEGDGR
jgi:hypothetical protein